MKSDGQQKQPLIPHRGIRKKRAGRERGRLARQPLREKDEERERRQGEEQQGKKMGGQGREQGKLWGRHNKKAYLINMSWSPVQSSATTESLCR